MLAVASPPKSYQVISLKRTWKPRPLGGEETFSWPEAGPDCDAMCPCSFNGPVIHRHEEQEAAQLKLF